MTKKVSKAKSPKQNLVKRYRISVKWTKTNFTEGANIHDTELYAISRGSNLLYIGKSFKQYVYDEAQSARKRKEEYDTRGLILWVGKIISFSGYANKVVTEQMSLDAECLLIYRNQPLKNEPCSKNYTKITPIKVVSYNCPLLKGTISHT